MIPCMERRDITKFSVAFWSVPFPSSITESAQTLRCKDAGGDTVRRNLPR